MATAGSIGEPMDRGYEKRNHNHFRVFAIKFNSLVDEAVLVCFLKEVFEYYVHMYYYVCNTLPALTKSLHLGDSPVTYG